MRHSVAKSREGIQLRIECRLIELTKIKLVFDYNVYSETGLLAADGNTIHVFTDQNLKLMKLTSDLYQRLKRITHEIHPDQ